MKIKKENLYVIISFVLLLIICYMAISVIFFKKISLSPSSDFNAYINNYMRFSERIWPKIDNLIDWFLNSASFHFLYEWLSIISGSPEYSLFGLSLVSGIGLVCLAVRRFSFTYLLPLLLLSHPRFLDLVVGQVRMALALVVFALALNIKNKSLSFLLIIAAVSIHLGIIIPIMAFFIYLLSKIIKRLVHMEVFESAGWRRFDLLNLLAIFALPSSYIIIVNIDFIQMIRGIDAGAGGDLYILMWVFTALGILFFAPVTLSFLHGFLFYSMIGLVSLGFFFDVYTSRIIALAIFFLAISLGRLSTSQQSVLYPIILPNLFLSYYYWI